MLKIDRKRGSNGLDGLKMVRYNEQQKNKNFDIKEIKQLDTGAKKKKKTMVQRDKDVRVRRQKKWIQAKQK